MARPLTLQTGDVWAPYIRGTSRRKPMKFVSMALALVGEAGDGRQAVDLGCGAGNETVFLLDAGWRVHAVDAEPVAIETLRNRAGDNPLLTTEVSRFHEANLPPADLILASLSLPFAGQDQESAIRHAIDALTSGGWFLGVLFGHNDTWAAHEDVQTVDRADCARLFSTLTDLDVLEEEFDGPSGTGPKHWHWYVVSGRRSS